MANVAILGGLLVAGAAAGYLAISRENARHKRESFVRQFVFPSSVLRALARTYPNLEEKDFFLVARALRSYFLVHLRARNQTVGMPSRVVDVLWHEFILDTKSYHAFCSKAFGSFFHHVPAGKTASPGSKSEGLRQTWRLACLEENIDPENATRLPLLFAIDSKLKIPDGHVYDLEVVKQPPRPDSGGCGGFGCAGSDSGSGGCNGGCGGGCGGD